MERPPKSSPLTVLLLFQRKCIRKCCPNIPPILRPPSTLPFHHYGSSACLFIHGLPLCCFPCTCVALYQVIPEWHYSPGPSGLRASHLKEGITCPSPPTKSNLLTMLTSFINLLCRGEVPTEVTPHLCGALLLATKKKSGGFHPIVVGEVIRCLASECVAQSIRQSAIDHLSPLQLGVGFPNGAEAIVHGVRSILNCDSLPTNRKYVLQVDFSNAFNSVNRLFESVREHLPSLPAGLNCAIVHLPSHAEPMWCSAGWLNWCLNWYDFSLKLKETFY